MVKNIGLFRLVGISLIAAAILSSCSAAVTPVVPATLAASPTPLNQGGPNAEVATNTPAAAVTAAPKATDTPIPTAAATATAVPTSTTQLAAQVIPTLNANCHKGPAAGYDATTFLLKGTAYNVTGRDSLNSWWQVQAPGNVTCWVPNANVTTQGSVEQVSIVQVPPLPGLPVPLDSSYVCKPSAKILTVALNWGAVYNATGYRIFRDGTKLVEVGSTVTSYSDDAAPLKETVVYELEAFNDYGVAARISTTIPACQ